MIPLTRPTLPSLHAMQAKMKHVFKSGMLTNAKYTQSFENKCAHFLGVRDSVAMSSGTSALMLVAKCLGLKGEVILPSFTFTSTGHSLLWNNLKPVFVDIDPETFNIDTDLIEKKITKKTCAIWATHVFGNPCDIDSIERIARKHNIKVIYDAAHAFGAMYNEKSVAHFGDISIYSFTPTKVLSTAEGGLAVAKSKKVTKLLQLGRNNGDSFNRKEEFLGISARMNEFSAILGIESLKEFKKYLKRRISMVKLYHTELRDVHGISFQKILPNAVSSHKDMAILVDATVYGTSRNVLLTTLSNKNIQAKVYFDPVLHKKRVYEKYKNISLPNTEYVHSAIVSLPLYSHMSEKEVKTVCTVIKKLAKHL
jgi:dTDP-4-amino-4,6-dideoxygalactose transaminase